MYISWNVRPIQNELIIHGTKGVMHVDCYLQVITLRKTYPAPSRCSGFSARVSIRSTCWRKFP
jgi:hypothetical protein